MRNAPKEKVDVHVAQFIYGSNLPFTIVEQPTFLALLKALRPGYKPPSCKTLAGPLLDKVHEKLSANVRSNLNGGVCCLIEDGWSNIRNEPVLATFLQFNGTTYFLRAVDRGSEEKTLSIVHKLPATRFASQRNNSGYAWVLS